MAILVRRSNLLIPVTDATSLGDAWRHNADAITLDLEDGIAMDRKAEGRALIKDAIAPGKRAAAEVFVRVNKPFLQADLEASVWPGISGVMLPQVESAEEVTEAHDILMTLERQRGIAAGSLQFIVLLESANAVWNIRPIIHALKRITQLALDESDLAKSMGIHPLPEFDPFVYARGRLIVEATAAGVFPVGMSYPLSIQPRLLPGPEIQRMANNARNLGMKGVVCLDPSWVGPVNTAFTPSAELVAYNRRVREAFAAGVAAGTAAVPLDGRMIDVPVDEWAKKVIETAEACAARDEAKRSALAKLHS